MPNIPEIHYYPQTFYSSFILESIWDTKTLDLSPNEILDSVSSFCRA